MIKRPIIYQKVWNNFGLDFISSTAIKNWKTILQESISELNKHHNNKNKSSNNFIQHLSFLLKIKMAKHLNMWKLIYKFKKMISCTDSFFSLLKLSSINKMLSKYANHISKWNYYLFKNWKIIWKKTKILF